jgi:SAM-dependent methyltransferase
VKRTLVDEPGDLRETWEELAPEVIAWFRTPGHDSYWRYHRDQFLDLLPPPNGLTIDMGCGEGRLSRDLKALGYRVVGCDISQTMVDAARAADPEIDVWRSPASAMPLADEAAELAVAFMSLQDMSDAAEAIREAHRVLRHAGRFCLAIVHPLNSAGRFEGDGADCPFVIRGTYLSPFRFRDEVERDGLAAAFESEHRPIEWYFEALESAGFLVERLRETDVPESAVTEPRQARWQRLPLFLHVRAVKP